MPTRGRSPSPKIKPVQVLCVHRQDGDGHLWAWAMAGKTDPIEVWLASGSDLPKLKIGTRALCQIGALQSDGTYRAKVIKALPTPSAQTIFGKVEGGWLRPSDRRDRKQYRLVGGLDHDEGHLVAATLRGPARRGAAMEAKVIEVLGHFGDVAAIAPLTLAEEGIPTQFSKDAIREAQAATAPHLDPFRIDLRTTPFVTIDGEDARDFDDAVYAQADPKVKGGWIIWVAIADVAAYVALDSALDKAARERGNSVYLPDHVVPMLPEVLSNGWCSLKPEEDRACLAVQLQIDPEGQLRHYKFVRGLMKSHARLTYTAVQAWMEGEKTALAPDLHPHIQNLVGAYHTLHAARERRGPLDLNMPERRALISADQTQVLDVVARPMGPANQLIEEMMILANVAAARAFVAAGCWGLYRVHDAPDRSRIEALAQILKGTPAELSQKAPILKPADFARILNLTKDQPYAQTVVEQVLRTQSMAIYDLTNIGHFALALPHYSHFTSPIRRYGDLMVHRALIAALCLGPGGVDLADMPKAGAIANHISQTERRAQMAERRAHDRYVAAYHSQDMGQHLEGRIAGMAKAGLFVRLDQSGADAFIPISLLGTERFDFDPACLTLSSRRTGQVFALGDRCCIRLIEACAHTGSLIGQMVRHIKAHGLGVSAKKSAQRSTRKKTKKTARSKR